MANVMQLIHYTIVFTIVFCDLIIGSWLVLPPLKIFIIGLRFPPLTAAYRAAMQAASYFIGQIIGVYFALYCVFKILRAIFPVNLVIGKIPPFKELRQAGIFGLFDSIINAIIQRGSIADRLKRVGKGLAGFVMSNFNMIRDTFKEMTGYNPPKISPTSLPPQSKPQDFPDNVDQSTSPFTQQDVQRTQQEYQQCLEETLDIVSPSMNDLERKAIGLKNDTATIICQLRAVQSALNNFAYRV